MMKVCLVSVAAFAISMSLYNCVLARGIPSEGQTPKGFIRTDGN